MPKQKQEKTEEANATNHLFQAAYGQNRVYFFVCKEKNTVRNILIKHEFGSETRLDGEYTLEELASPRMNRANLVSAIQKCLEFERNRLPNQGAKVLLPW